MTKPRRMKAQTRPSKYRRRARRQSGYWRRDGSEWAWTDHLWKGVKSTWLALWRGVWRLHIGVVIVATLLVVGNWTGWFRLLPEAWVVPVRASVILYWLT